MAQNYEIDIKRFNGQDYDTLLPTPASHASTHQAGGSDPITMQTGNYANGSVTAEKLAPDAIPDALGFNPGMVNPNLLDNWYFVGGGSQQGGGQFPINQRGQTSYGAEYTIDRWISTTAGFVNVQANGINLDASNGEIFFENHIENGYWGNTLTLTALTTDNELVSCTGQMPNAAGSSNTQIASVNGSSFILRFYSMRSTITDKTRVQIVLNQGQSVTLIAVKLELGLRQTLAHQENGQWVLNEIPDFGEQLTRCQRYSIPVGKNRNWALIGSLSKCIDAAWLNVLIYTPVPMRGNPSVLIHGTFQENTGGKAVSSITATQIFPGAINLLCNIPGLTPGTYTFLQGREDAWLELNNNL